MNIKEILEKLTLDEKIALVSGTDNMYTNSVPRLNIPTISMADGPHGVRKQTGATISMSEPATTFPTAVCTASGWNPDNLYTMGRAIAEECLGYGVDILLGPGVNIKRNPLCGRNFEYFSEDPLLAGKSAAAMVKGVQDGGVSTSLKHFAMNNSENYRFMGNSAVDMRAAREIYLKAFETVIREAKPDTVMCSYNQINGIYASENDLLLNKILREEWGFEGAVMTDWGAMHNRPKSIKSGLDLEMPGDSAICRKELKDAIEKGEVSQEILDTAVERILKLADKAEKRTPYRPNLEEHHQLAGKIAADCAVLMKNDGVLPLKTNEKLCIIGEMFDKIRYQGSGSSMVNSTRVVSCRNAFDERKIDYVYSPGYKINEVKANDMLISEALLLAKDFEKAVVFAGTTDRIESEATDRENMKLSENQTSLINALIDAGKKIILVLSCGSAVELPFAAKVSAILNMFLPGQNGGEATAALLLGEVSPSGRLSESWPISYDDVPFGKDFGKHINEIYYESVFVGYRYYTSKDAPVLYPFGHGLSYTSFEYEDMSVSKGDEKITITVKIRNTGTCYGGEVVQLYVSAPCSDVFKPKRELRAFSKVYLKPGECKTVDLAITTKDLAYYNIKTESFITESGEYSIEICRDCETVLLSHSIDIEGENAPSPYSKETNNLYTDLSTDSINLEEFEKMSCMKVKPEPPILPITMESPFANVRHTILGNMIYKLVLSVSKKQMKEAKKLPEGPERDNKIKDAEFMEHSLRTSSLISMSMASAKLLPYQTARGLIYLANGRVFKAIVAFCSKIKVPPLPKEARK